MGILWFVMGSIVWLREWPNTDIETIIPREFVKIRDLVRSKIDFQIESAYQITQYQFASNSENTCWSLSLILIHPMNDFVFKLITFNQRGMYVVNIITG